MGGRHLPITLPRYRIYICRKRVGVVTEPLDGVQIETSDVILRAELDELLSNPTAERIGGTCGSISWDGIGPTLHPGDPGHVRVALHALYGRYTVEVD
jgi:hypothetical protein